MNCLLQKYKINVTHSVCLCICVCICMYLTDFHFLLQNDCVPIKGTKLLPSICCLWKTWHHTVSILILFIHFYFKEANEIPQVTKQCYFCIPNRTCIAQVRTWMCTRPEGFGITSGSPIQRSLSCILSCGRREHADPSAMDLYS